MYIYIYVYVYVHIYTHIYKFIYIYIYIHISYIQIRHVSRIHESCHAYNCGMSRMKFCRVTRKKATMSCFPRGWVALHNDLKQCHVPNMNASCRTHDHNISLFSHIWFVTSHVCETWLIHMCDMTSSYVWHDLFICVKNEWITCVRNEWISLVSQGGQKEGHISYMNTSFLTWMLGVSNINASCLT